jgi:hypothetical protein
MKMQILGIDVTGEEEEEETADQLKGTFTMAFPEPKEPRCSPAIAQQLQEHPPPPITWMPAVPKAATAKAAAKAKGKAKAKAKQAKEKAKQANVAKRAGPPLALARRVVRRVGRGVATPMGGFSHGSLFPLPPAPHSPQHPQSPIPIEDSPHNDPGQMQQHAPTLRAPSPQHPIPIEDAPAPSVAGHPPQGPGQMQQQQEAPAPSTADPPPQGPGKHVPRGIRLQRLKALCPFDKQNQKSAGGEATEAEDAPAVEARTDNCKFMDRVKELGIPKVAWPQNEKHGRDNYTIGVYASIHGCDLSLKHEQVYAHKCAYTSDASRNICLIYLYIYVYAYIYISIYIYIYICSCPS